MIVSSWIIEHGTVRPLGARARRKAGKPEAPWPAPHPARQHAGEGPRSLPAERFADEGYREELRETARRRRK